MSDSSSDDFVRPVDNDDDHCKADLCSRMVGESSVQVLPQHLQGEANQGAIQANQAQFHKSEQCKEATPAPQNYDLYVAQERSQDRTTEKVKNNKNTVCSVTLTEQDMRIKRMLAGSEYPSTGTAGSVTDSSGTAAPPPPVTFTERDIMRIKRMLAGSESPSTGTAGSVTDSSGTAASPPSTQSENGDVHADQHYLKEFLERLCAAAPAGQVDSTQLPTLYRVPEELKFNTYNPEGEYEPVAVRIGTTSNVWSRCWSRRWSRHDTKELENYKWCCARQLISRHSRLLEPARTLVLLHECFTTMKRLVPKIGASYSESAMIYEDKVDQMMLLDGCFILHRLLKYARRANMEAGGGSDQFVDDGDDWTQVYGRCFVWQLVTRDLLLLENQIPFFVIRELFKQLRNEDEPEELLVTGSLRLFRSLRPQMLHRSPIACDDVHHLLHLFYLSVGRPPSDRQQHPRPRRTEELLSEFSQWIPCAKELEEAGVRFRKRENATSFLDVSFSRGVLEIPQLELNDYSESLFRNLIAFEQTYPDTPRDVSIYAVFMDCLVTSPEDMRILDLHGVLINHLNSRRVAWQFFSDIVRQVHWSADNYLVGLMNEVNSFRERRRHKWRAALARNYFSNPWVTMSVFAALLLLSMAVLQTFFAVYVYFKPPK